MSDIIENLLTEVYQNLKSDRAFLRHDKLSISLMSGKAGAILFNHFYYKYLNHGLFPDDHAISVQELAEEAIDYFFPSLCEGRAGVNWLFSYLYKFEIIEEEDYALLCNCDEGLKAIALKMLSADNYDYLHGAAGIAFYILYMKKDGATSFFEDFFHLLREIQHKANKGCLMPAYDLKTFKIKADETNLGIAHGICSILKLSLECYRLNICKVQAGAIAKEIVSYLVEHTNTDKSRSYYPAAVHLNDENDSQSRLGWCYGDLCIAFLFYQAAELFCDESLKSFALEILRHNTSRRNYEETSIKDAGFCHGTAGVAHIFNKLWHLNGDPLFKEACDYWIDRTIELGTQHKNSVSFNKYNYHTQSFEPNLGLLEGDAGVGLVLISYLTGDFSWDYCFMLN